MSEIPKLINQKKNSQQLEITWTNGDKTYLSFQELRKFCPCSQCRALGHTGVDIITDNYDIERIHPMGSSGLQIVFKDGHDKGIYPWAYLKAIAEDRALQVLYGT